MTNELTLEQVLKDYNTRLSNGDKWLVWSSFGGNLWTVYQRERYAKTTKTLMQTEDLAQALAVLGLVAEV
jgi:hypothetical protein